MQTPAVISNLEKRLEKNIPLPLYYPDATLGVVRSMDSHDLKKSGISGLVVNTFHLREKPGTALLKKLGGIKKLMNWPGLITSDSGGFQLFSLIQNNPKMGKVVDNGLVLYTGKNKQNKEIFTPEKSIQIQFAIGSDIMICLDDFTSHDASLKEIEQTVARTIDWARRSKIEFEKQVKKHGFTDHNRPLLLAPIQGHNHRQLRQKCAQALVKINFDGYGLGGWLFGEDGKLDYELCQFNAELTPDDKLRFALGIGKPEDIVRLFEMGYHMFDCVLPTRDARHQRLYTLTKNLDNIGLDELSQSQKKPGWYEYLYINRGAFKDDLEPVSQFCGCPTCQNYSRAYLHHLFKIKDSAAFRMATLHNLYFYASLIKKLQKIEVV